jgi:hypothetical protein
VGGKRKTSSSAQTPPGTANSIQGVCVKGVVHSEASTHPVMIWVTS